jgi:hypothetical protein
MDITHRMDIPTTRTIPTTTLTIRTIRPIQPTAATLTDPTTAIRPDTLLLMIRLIRRRQQQIPPRIPEPAVRRQQSGLLMRTVNGITLDARALPSYASRRLKRRRNLRPTTRQTTTALPYRMGSGTGSALLPLSAWLLINQPRALRPPRRLTHIALLSLRAHNAVVRVTSRGAATEFSPWRKPWENGLQ